LAEFWFCVAIVVNLFKVFQAKFGANFWYFSNDRCDSLAFTSRLGMLFLFKA